MTKRRHFRCSKTYAAARTGGRTRPPLTLPKKIQFLQRQRRNPTERQMQSRVDEIRSEKGAHHRATGRSRVNAEGRRVQTADTRGGGGGGGRRRCWWVAMGVGRGGGEREGQGA